jgi:hypothetical protein
MLKLTLPRLLAMLLLLRQMPLKVLQTLRRLSPQLMLRFPRQVERLRVM